MVFFIPWRVVAEESGAAHFGFGGAMLLHTAVFAACLVIQPGAWPCFARHWNFEGLRVPPSLT